ncbi:MAG TPA: two-component regulator propeller domain-containing protein [Bacteroidales bacterium]|nr:two-component regulator propeller domain-containing protein [Bacteroidales bacterium]
MVNKLNQRISTGITVCLLLVSGILNGQTLRFKNYGTDSKIPDGFVYSLIQGNNGYLWVGTGNGLSKFDGFDFYNVEFPDSVQRYPTSDLKDINGTLWFGCNDGSVFYSQNEVLKPLSTQNEKSVSTIISGPDNFIYIIPQGGHIYKVNPSKPEEIIIYPLDKDFVVFSACFTRSGNLLLGTQDGIKVCSISNDAISITSSIEGFNYSNVLAIDRINDKDLYLIGTDGSGLYRLEIAPGKNTLSHFDNYKELATLDIKSIFKDSENYYWISTNDYGILNLRLDENGESVTSESFIDKKSGLPGNNVKLVYQDNEGNYWIGLFGDGLSMLNSVAFSFYSPGTTSVTRNIIYINKLATEYFLGTPAGFYLFDFTSNKVKSFTDILKRTGNSEVASYCIENEDNVWIGTKGAGLYLRTGSGVIQPYFKSGNSGEDYIQDVEVDNKYIWLGTLNGVVLIDRSTRKIDTTYNIDNGLPHNSINHLCLTSSGKVAVATKTDRLYLIDPEAGIIPGKAVMYGTRMNEILSMTEGNDGSLWAATYGNGIFKFSGDSLASFSRADMLLSDYCYSILADKFNAIWIGHERGFSVYFRDRGIFKTFNTDFAKSGVCNAGGMYQSAEGNIFIGTTEGVIFYNRSKDKKVIQAPINNVNDVTINDIVYPFKSSFSLPYSKRYNIKVGYTGINFRDPEKVYYQTRLDNYDDDWTKPSPSREAVYHLNYGKYKFNLKSFNDEGLTDSAQVSFDITIKKPLVKTWGFILSVFALIAGGFVLILKQREKEQKKVQDYLEKELDARTSVVLKQKGEIELQNIEITDSINYAKRIQTSILPDFNRVKETFSDAFLFFRPRDIVSGDFYWFDKIDDDRFMLVCADSTGHGVPGAFMSMIGSTLLQDIVTRQHVYKPSEILTRLDKQIFSTLNQNVELGVSNDGMDVVICEINAKTRHIRFASAMRPVILVMDNEPYYIKGNRSSVGGESVIEKYFDDQEYYLNAGDTIYMFSDGLPDQFGGTDGKKMKIARLKKLIEDVSNLNMSGQKEVITKFYDEWKGIHDQVDDVMLIGIRL